MEKIIINGREICYELTRKKVKNINIRISSNGILKISANNRVSKKYINEIIISNAEHFIRSIDKINEKRQRETNTEKTMLLGKEYPINIHCSDTEKVSFNGSNFDIFTKDIEDRDNILFLILKYKSDLCVKVFSEINLKVYNKFKEAGHKLPFAVVTVKLMKTRWGSCNYVKGKFSMNLRLIDHPYECIYGVFCHEYAHFIHHDHSKDFYRCVTDIFPEYKKYDKLLRE